VQGRRSFSRGRVDLEQATSLVFPPLSAGTAGGRYNRSRTRGGFRRIVAAKSQTSSGTRRHTPRTKPDIQPNTGVTVKKRCRQITPRWVVYPFPPSPLVCVSLQQFWFRSMSAGWRRAHGGCTRGPGGREMSGPIPTLISGNNLVLLNSTQTVPKRNVRERTAPVRMNRGVQSSGSCRRCSSPAAQSRARSFHPCRRVKSC